MWPLFVANLKMIVRNRQTLFWALVFPIIFITVFGLFNLDEVAPAKVGFIDQAGNASSEQIRESLEKIELLELAPRSDVDQATTELAAGDLDFVLRVPASFSFPSDTAQELELFSDPTNIQANQVVVGTLQSFADQSTLNLLGAKPALAIVDTPISSRNIRYIDFLTPGIIGQAIMMSAVMGIAVGVSRYREQKVLKRILATPLKIRNFLVTEVAARLVLSMIQTTLVIVVARLVFDVHVFGEYWPIYLVSALGSIIFLEFGFFIAGVTNSAAAAEGLANVTVLPLMFLSGVFFAPEALPTVVRTIVDYLPLAPLIETMRGLMLHQQSLGDFNFELSLLAIWALVMFLLAWHTFKFDRESRG
jgi:ABC-2 type transport system permease protein